MLKERQGQPPPLVPDGQQDENLLDDRISTLANDFQTLGVRIEGSTALNGGSPIFSASGFGGSRLRWCRRSAAWSEGDQARKPLPP